MKPTATILFYLCLLMAPLLSSALAMNLEAREAKVHYVSPTDSG